ncbi:MAG TPA: uroporphyrinogen-III synthase [Vicinamibacterales bacterium]|jgi:uroporphyrinogen-III synthase
MPIQDETRTFRGLRVLTLESRRGAELAALIRTFGGQPIEAPALREVPLESHSAALAFAQALMRDEYDFVIFLTGVGVRTLVSAVERAYPRATFLAALARTKTIVRGPKPLAALRELQVPVWAAAPEPNTWRDVLTAIEAKDATRLLDGARIAVQEYGVSNPELLEELRGRGAHVTPVPVYRWALPENLEPLRNAVRAIARGEVDVALFTTSVQIVHLWQIAEDLHLERDVASALAQTVIASIGPTTSEELKRRGLTPDLEASHPKIGILVREAAEQSPKLLEGKRT